MKRLSIITSYPARYTVHGGNTVGGASYTKNLVTYLSNADPSIQFDIFAEIFKTEEEYTDDNVTIHRVWKRNNLTNLILFLWNILKTQKKVLVSYEYNMFGGAATYIIFFLWLLIAKINGVQVSIILHHVIERMDGLEKNAMKRNTISLIAYLLHRYLLFTVEKVIVFEQKFKQTLFSSPKVFVIPHAVERVVKLNTVDSKQKLGLDPNKFCLLYFGYISPYKGIDTLIDSYDGSYNLIVAGGANPNHMKNKEYKTYVESVIQTGREKGALVPGYVNEEDISLYYSAADAVILPYKVFFSSSGPLSLAFAHEKPVILSAALKDYFLSDDFVQGLKESEVQQTDMIFQPRELSKVVETVVSETDKYVHFSSAMKQLRSWDSIAKRYLEVL